MQQQYSLNEVQIGQDQKIILPIVALSQKSVQAVDQSHCHIPLKPFLQLEELSECGVCSQITELFPWWR
jgi:hypothetical protein